MYTIEQHSPEIRLISNLNGVIIIYPNYESFIDNMDYSFIERRVVTTFRDLPRKWTWLNFSEISDPIEKFVVRDKFGSVFSPNEIYNDFIIRHRTSPITMSWHRTRYDFIYRQTPVPGTSTKRWRFSRWYKKPKTTQECKQFYAHKKYVRGRRRPNALPNTYDDIIRGDVNNRKCWKNKKIRMQWMKNIGSF